ncbi:response regulator [Paroceanicella profunda]|uniref:Response regulator n=1 Tax=Paroceanicella profunda TaxID=2579971 RepID=A0A5B8FSY0_9RHOB|nr:response regulator [Paroceanicella profunda]QDL91846.1 response regulator [Paroceanicella profunda]
MTRRVLIIEDEPNIIESLAWLLGREGFDVTSEQDGAAALDRIAREAPDLVILDVMLPQCDGFEILRAIRAGKTTARTPVIMLTARGQARDRDTAEKLGVDLFITKPFLNSHVVESARRLAARTAP